MSDNECQEKPKKVPKHDVTVLAIDVGVNMRGDAFRDAIQTAEWLLTRKIMRQNCEIAAEEKKLYGTTTSKGDERFAIVVFGSDQTRNELGVEGVQIGQDVLEKALFDHMRFLNELQPSANVSGDFVDGLIVSVDFLRSQIDGDEAVVHKRIVLLTNGEGVNGVDREALDGIANGLQALGSEFYVVGISDSNADEAPGVLSKFAKDIDGHVYSFSNAGDMISQLSSHQKLTRLIGFNLQISENVKLPLKCIPYISKTRSDKEERMRAVDPNTLQGVRRIRKFVTTDTGDDLSASTQKIISNSTGDTPNYARPNDTQASNAGNLILGTSQASKKEELMDTQESTAPAAQVYTQVEQHELANAYLFGASKVIMANDDRERYNLSFNEKEKGGTLELICTAPKEAIHAAHLVGDETRVFIPDERKENGRGIPAVSAFVRALINENAVGIARFAWNKASEPHMIALVPKEHEVYGTPMLFALRLPFADDIRHTELPKLETVDKMKSATKLDLLDDLIDAYQKVEETSSENESRRVLNSYLKRNQMIFKKVGLTTYATKEEAHAIPTKAKEIIAQLKKEFPIEDFKVKKRDENAKRVIAEVDVDALAVMSSQNVEDDEDVKPIKEDLDAKIAKGGMTLFLKEQFAHIIVNAGTDDIDLTKLRYARSWCVSHSKSSLFNDLMKKLRNLDDVVEWASTVKDSSLLPIDNSESNDSDISPDEASEWWTPKEESQWAEPDPTAPDLED